MTDNRLKTYIFDLDGVIYRGDEPVPHAAEALRELRRRGCTIFFFTNNATKSREFYQKKLAGMGIESVPDEMMTSAYATSVYLREIGKGDARVYVVGEGGLIHELESAGIKVVNNGGHCENIDFVVVGLDREFNYEKLRQAQQAIFSGAKFIATNTDATLPIEGGRLDPGGGTMVAAVRTATGVAPHVIGKPETYALEKIVELSGCTPDECVIIGDRIETDILTGNRVGMHTIMVLTGISTEADVATAPEDMKPERIINDLSELLDDCRCSE